MRQEFTHLRRRSVLAGLALATVTLTAACGGDADSPEAVTIDELKYPGNLKILDQGGGTVKLTWSGSNNEKDFDGYNVYGMKAQSDDYFSGLKEGEALQLLDEKGEAIEAKRQLLTKFHYGPDTGLDKPAAQPSALQDDKASDEGKNKARFLPIHTLNADGKPVLPTCFHDGNGTCVAKTKDNASTTPSKVNGEISYTVDGLKIGERYCFLILSSMDENSGVSQTTSNMACVVPAYQVQVNLKYPEPSANRANSLRFGLREYLAACSDNGCPTDLTNYLVVDAGTHNAQDEAALYIESGTLGMEFIAGMNSGINDIGVYLKGFADPTLPPKPPKFTLDSNLDTNKAPIFNGGGYSRAGQSLPVIKDHIYVVAVGPKGAQDKTPETFHYAWILITGDVTQGKDVQVTIRLAKDAI